MRILRAPFLCLVPGLTLLGCGESPTAPTTAPAASTGVRADPPTVPGPIQPEPDSARPVRPSGPVRSIGDAAVDEGPFAREQDQIDVIGSTISSSTASGAVGLNYRARFVPGYPGLIEFILNNTGSGWQEKFLVQVPPTPPTSPVPMLVVFHKFGSSHGDVLNTTFLAETQARGWYCVAPLGARQKHFGNNESQINTRAALDLVAHLFPVDRARVYGVGFSMGAGALTNYAARHLDPAGIQFAAICEHTGGVSLAHTWFNEPDDADLDDDLPLPGQNLEVPDVLEDLFGGTPSQNPFAYQRASSIDLDPITGQIGVGTDLGRNLEHVPTSIWIANADPLAYLAAQTYAFDGYLQPQNVGHTLTVVTGNTHTWQTLDETAVCDWLQTKTLQTPTSGRTLADEDGNWHHFRVEQDFQRVFTPFTWSIDVPSATVEIVDTANLKRITLDAASVGLALSGVVTLRLSFADGSGDRVRLLGAANAPVAVLRDGVAASGTYDAFTQSFEVHETSTAVHVWTLTFP